MRREIIFKGIDWELTKEILAPGGDNESSIVLFVKEVKSSNLRRYLVVDAYTPNESDLPIRNAGYVKLGPEFMETCFQKCENEALHMIDAHSHPFSDQPSFSGIDDHEDSKVKGPYFDNYLPKTELLFIVCGKNPDRLDARMWDKETHSLTQIDLVKII